MFVPNIDHARPINVASNGIFKVIISWLARAQQTSSRSSLNDARCASSRVAIAKCLRSSGRTEQQPRDGILRFHFKFFRENTLAAAVKTIAQISPCTACFAGSVRRNRSPVRASQHVEILKVRKQVGKPSRESRHRRAHHSTGKFRSSCTTNKM